MSYIFQQITARVLRASARGIEANSTVLLAGLKSGGWLLVYATSIYSAGSVFGRHVLSWSFCIGPSMYPTQPSTESVVFIDKSKKRGRGLQIGDVIQFHNPVFGDQLNGKRIIGMPGDYVVRDPYSAPTVGGAAVPGITDWRSVEEVKRGVVLREREEPEMIRVPEGHVWVTGDNMSWSRDSRFYGPLPMALIQGRSFVCGDGVFTWHTLGRGMTRIPKDQEDDYLNGRDLIGRDAGGIANAVTNVSFQSDVD